MRTVVLGTAAVAALIATYVTASATLNGLTSGYGTTPAFFVVGGAVLALACAAAYAERRHSRAAQWLFVAGALVAIVAWPYRAAGIVMALGALLAAFERWRSGIASTR